MIFPPVFSSSKFPVPVFFHLGGPGDGVAVLVLLGLSAEGKSANDNGLSRVMLIRPPFLFYLI
jgi:hypothetical protein